MSERLEIVTIDGPSGVGKSTVSRLLARELGYTYLDTGAMYRAVALACRLQEVEPENEEALAPILADLRIELLPPEMPEGDVRVLLNGVEVGDQLRSPEMGMLASRVSARMVVRERLTRLQQEMGRQGRLVAEGRDTGTVVFPGAAWKFYLDAEPEERARRRADQLRRQGRQVDESAVLEQIILRDRHDRNRSIAPLRAAPDAVHIDATRLDADGVVARMVEVVRATGS